MKELELEQQIRNCYNDAEFILALIEKYDLGSVIARSIEEISYHIINNQLNAIPSIATSILTNVNHLLKKIKNIEHKSKLEYLLADIFQELLTSIPQTESGVKTIKELKKSIETCCRIGGFDFKEFSRFISFDNFIKKMPLSGRTNYYYQWRAEDWELDALSNYLKQRKLIVSVVEFKNLFKPIYHNLTVKCIHEKRDKLFILFHFLKVYCFIKPKGTSGHLKPFIRYSIQENGDCLFKMEPNKYHNYLKKDKTNYSHLKDFAETVLLNCLGKTIGQWIDNGNCPRLSAAKLT